MARLILVHAPDAESLLAAAAAPFAVQGRPAEPLPLLAVRQGGQREEVLARAAAAGCAGWLGEPILVFRELLERISDGDVAALTSFERETLIARLLRRPDLAAFGAIRHLRGLVRALDELFGRLAAVEVALDRLAEALERLSGGAWERARDADLRTLYADWLEAVAALPPLGGRPRVDGRDAAARAARVVRNDPGRLARRLARPFAPAGRPLDLWLLGLTDLSGGWELLLDALRESAAIRELRVLVLAASPRAAPLERLAEHELVEALRRRADEVVALEAAPRPAGIARLSAELFLTQDGGAEDEGAAGVGAAVLPDGARELADVAREAKRLIAEERVEPRRIAVVVRALRPEGPRLAHELRRQGVPVTARIRYRAAEIPAVAALLRLFRVAAEGWSRRVLLDLAESPYFELDLDGGALAFAAGQARPDTLARWRTVLEGLAARAEAAEADEAEPRPRGPSATRLRAAAERIEGFAAHAAALEETRRRSAWIDLALRVLGEADADAPWRLEHCARALPGGREADPLAVEAVRLDLQGLATATDALRDWRRALALDPEADGPLEPAAWHAELTSRLQDADFALWTPERGGVHVLESLAAVGRPFDHLFIIGMAAGEIPADPPAQPLFSDQEAEALERAGLPFRPEAAWFAREASLFRELVAGARRTLALSYAAADPGGAARLASPYLEECALLLGTDLEAWARRPPGSALVPSDLAAIRSPGEALLFAARDWRDQPSGHARPRALLRTLLDAAPGPTRGALRGAWVEWVRARTRESETASRLERLHAYNGRIDAADLREALRARWGERPWSASRLETYGFCGFRFFAEQVLGLASVDEADDDLDAATRGKVLHATLARLDVELRDRYGDAALDPAHEDDAAALLERILPEELEAEGDGGWAGAPELREPRLANLRRMLMRYVHWEMAENAKGSTVRPARAPLFTELAFGAPGDQWETVEIEADGRSIRVRGRIDRVDEIVDPRARGWRYVVDHKTSAAAFDHIGARRAAGALLQLPIYMRALEAVGEAGLGVWGGSYQIIGDPDHKASLSPTSLVKAGIKREETEKQRKATEEIEAAVRHAIEHATNIAAGRFPAATPTGCACPAYCAARAVCREYHG